MFDFRSYQVQAVLFVSSDQPFRNAKVLGHFLAERSDLFDGEPSAVDPPPNVLFPGLFLPRVVLKSQDGRLLLEAGKDRVQFTRIALFSESVDIDRHLQEAVGVLMDYQTIVNVQVNRLAVIVNRAAASVNPARDISRHFCREQFVEGPINRPSEFEIHSLKQYRLARLGKDLNSWFRCRSTTLRIHGRGTEEGRGERVVDVEQDINTPEAVPGLLFEVSEIKSFFMSAFNEIQEVMNLYFPPRREGL